MLMPNILELTSPKTSLPLIFDSPHSGTFLPDDFDFSCDAALFEKSADLYVDDLFNTVSDHGAHFLRALVSRSYIDLNRAADDIDPDLLRQADRYNWDQGYLPMAPTNRSHAGIGLIRRLIRLGIPIYNRSLSPKEIKSRIETYYNPYHETLERLIEDAHYNYGQVWHINCHSMPSASLAQSALGRVNPAAPPDFVLGNRDGTSCSIDFTNEVRNYITSMGYKVAINTPYKGVELIERYSNPTTGRHSLQIEISRALYLNEETYQKSKNYEKLKGDVEKLIGFCADYAQSQPIKLAAD